jgi:hypothetical protein
MDTMRRAWFDASSRAAAQSMQAAQMVSGEDPRDCTFSRSALNRPLRRTAAFHGSHPNIKRITRCIQLDTTGVIRSRLGGFKWIPPGDPFKTRWIQFDTTG